MPKLMCPVCDHLCNVGERYCNECGSVERHRALVTLIKEKNINIKNKKILIISEGKRENGKYYETSYYLAKHSNLTTLDIIPHCTYFGDKQSYDIYESIEKATSIKDNSFDFVIANHVLTAVKNDLTALSEISRILKNDGLFIINDGFNRVKTENFIAKKGQFTRRHYNKLHFISMLEKFFQHVDIESSDDLIFMEKNIEFIMCKNKKKYRELGSSTLYCDKGWWRHIIIVFGRSRTGTSSLEIALQKLGYNSIFIDKNRAKQEKKMKQYNTFFSNIENNKPFFDNIEENVFILGSYLKNDIEKIYNYYPGIKIICTNRNDNDWVISMKNHQLVANRPNPRRMDLIKEKESFIKNIINQVSNIKYFLKSNFLTLYVDNSNKKNLLCDFLHIKTERRNFIYPHISTNKKLNLTREQIEF